jgi:predicted acetyltransferase
MTNVSIRPLQGEEYLDVLYNLGMYAFHPSPPFKDKAEWAQIVRERKGVTYHTVFEDGQAVAGAASTAMTQNVRGKLFPAGGVWGVVTLPVARRKGYSRQVLADLLSAVNDTGAVFSNLYPFRESFYERLGYVTLPLPVIARFSPSSLAPLLGKDHRGEVKLMLIGDAFDTYRDFLARLRPQVHGMAFFDIGDRMAAQQNRSWVALAEVDGEIEGLMLYNLQGEDVTKFNFCAYRFYYTTSRARYLLLDWIARHIDQADRAEIWLPPYEHPETWLADMQVRIESQVRAPMSRVLSVSGLSGMETEKGGFSASIRDPLCPFNEDIWNFQSINGHLQVSKTDRADCELTVQGLTALILGTHDPQDFALRGWGDPAPEIQAVMRAMFPPRTPFLHENF